MSGASTAADQPSQVVVVGSLHYDIVVDAPGRPRKGETLAGRSWTPMFGGKGGNQAAAAQRQGVATAMVGAVGNDAFGMALLADLDRAKVDRSAVAVVKGAGSGMSVAIFDDEGDYGAVIVSGANLAISAAQAGDELLRKAKALVLQNEIPEHVNETVARRGRQHGVTTILNAAPARPFETGLPDLVDILVVNAIEAEMLDGGKVECLADAAAAAELLSARFKAAIVTAGGDGVAFSDRSGQRIELAGVPVVVASTHGAGDSFVGTLAARLAMGASLSDAMHAANLEAARWVALPQSLRLAQRA